MFTENIEKPEALLVKNYDLETEQDYLFWSNEYESWVIGYLSSKNIVLLYEFNESLALHNFTYFCIMPIRIKESDVL